MEPVVVSLTARELDRLPTLEQLAAGGLTQADAARLLGLSRRQVKRLWAAFRRDGPAALSSKRRGRPSNRRTPPERLATALALVRERYGDFGPTLASEKLAELHHLQLDHETLRRAMIAAGLWEPGRRRRRRLHPPRQRRPCRGELVQIDGSIHDWFEGRGPRCTLLVAIDDATSELLALRFELAETRTGYFALLQDYLREHGRPRALYADGNSIFRTPIEGGENKPTQFGRAMEELDSDLLCAATPQAKGRVERANSTLQRRLIKELRLADIATIDAANAFLGAYRKRHNDRFAIARLCQTDAHRSIEGFNLERFLCTCERRVVSAARTLSYYNRQLLIAENVRLDGRRVEVRELNNGELRIEQHGRTLPFRELEPAAHRPALVHTKDLQRTAPTPSPPKADHPWKRPFSPLAAARSTGTSLSSRTGT